MTIGYIYLLREREFIKTGENVYKIGKTKQEFPTRFNQYPNGTEHYFTLRVEDIDLFEIQMIDIFNKLFKKMRGLGNEYFEGDPVAMMNLIFSYFNINNNNNKKKTDEQILKEEKQIREKMTAECEKEEKKERLKEEK